VQQHQLIYSALQQAMSSEAIHALALKTYTPQAWQAVSRLSKIPVPLLMTLIESKMEKNYDSRTERAN